MEPEPTLTREAARAVDRRAIEEWGIPSFALMESAGRACADVAIAALETPPAAPVCVLCGPGNNGGDGLVVARTLVNRGHPARVVAVGGVARLERGSDDVRRNLHLWRGLGHPVEDLLDPDDVPRLAATLDPTPLVVDALFGTGLTRPLTGVHAALVHALAQSSVPVLAVDLPSGLDADTGQVLGAAVRATVTVTFVAPKRGFSLAAGPSHVGRLVVAEIGIPRAFVLEATEPAP